MKKYIFILSTILVSFSLLAQKEKDYTTVDKTVFFFTKMAVKKYKISSHHYYIGMIDENSKNYTAPGAFIEVPVKYFKYNRVSLNLGAVSLYNWNENDFNTYGSVYHFGPRYIASRGYWHNVYGVGIEYLRYKKSLADGYQTKTPLYFEYLLRRHNPTRRIAVDMGVKMIMSRNLSPFIFTLGVAYAFGKKI